MERQNYSRRHLGADLCASPRPTGKPYFLDLRGQRKDIRRPRKISIFRGVSETDEKDRPGEKKKIGVIEKDCDETQSEKRRRLII